MFKCVSRRLHALNMMFKCLVDISIPANLLFAGSPQKYTVLYISEKHKREKTLCKLTRINIWILFKINFDEYRIIRI